MHNQNVYERVSCDLKSNTLKHTQSDLILIHKATQLILNDLSILIPKLWGFNHISIMRTAITVIEENVFTLPWRY